MRKVFLTLRIGQVLQVPTIRQVFHSYFIIIHYDKCIFSAFGFKKNCR
jgi:hypothetical protein